MSNKEMIHLEERTLLIYHLDSKQKLALFIRDK
jgi:hypothetical protein